MTGSATPAPAATPALPPGPAEEIAAAWRALPFPIVLAGLLVVWVVLFQFLGNSTFGYIDTASLFGWLNYSYTNSHDDELGRLVPLIVLGLCWWRREELLAVPKSGWWPAVLLVAGALLLHVAGFAIQQTRISVVAFFLGIYGLMGAIWGWRWLKAVFFPFFLFAFCVPLGTLGETITFPLRMLATSITTGLSHTLLGIDVIRNGTQLLDARGAFRYDVATACGGLRSVTATLALSLIYAFVALDRPWKRLVVIAAAFPLAVAGNVLRLLTIIVAAEAFGQSAGDWVHDNAWLSLLPYVPVFLGLGLLGTWLKDRGPSVARVPTQSEQPA